MVSLLFIANSPAVDGLKTALQQVLKVRIDCVADFDHGLKDVFEKRPSIVCIQEQIQGVTGESVARHIQMLLGNSAPTFIVVHETSSRIKPIKGLFEHLIDLNQAPDRVVADMMNSLKSVLGSSWESICITPKRKTASERAAAIVPAETKEFADKLVDDLILDLDSLGPRAEKQLAAEEAKTEEKQELSVDDTAELLIEESLHAKETELHDQKEKDDSFFVVSSAEELANMGEGGHPPASPPVADPVMPSEKSALTDVPLSEPVAAAASEVVVQKLVDTQSPEKNAPTVKRPETEIRPMSGKKTETVSTCPDSPGKSTEVKNAVHAITKPADFSISRQSADVEEIPEDLLLEFEKNFRSQSASRSKIITISLVVLLACGAAGWYVLKKNPAAVTQTVPTAPKPAATVAVAIQPAPAATVQKPHSSHAISPVASQTPQKAAAPTLPKFIPAKGLDASYAAKKPGWERYVGSAEEFRLFRVDGKIKALQVLSRKGEPISEVRFTSVLKEIAGDGKLTITSNETKQGFKVGKGTVSSNAEVLVYRKKGTVRAFVISLN